MSFPVGSPGSSREAEQRRVNDRPKHGRSMVARSRSWTLPEDRPAAAIPATQERLVLRGVVAVTALFGIAFVGPATGLLLAPWLGWAAIFPALLVVRICLGVANRATTRLAATAPDPGFGRAAVASHSTSAPAVWSVTSDSTLAASGRYESEGSSNDATSASDSGPR